MNELRGVKLMIAVPPFSGDADGNGAHDGITVEGLERIAKEYNARPPQPIPLSGSSPARLVRVYVKDGVLYGDLEDVSQALIDNLKALKQEDVSLRVTLHLGDETK